MAEALSHSFEDREVSANPSAAPAVGSTRDEHGFVAALNLKHERMMYFII